MAKRSYGQYCALARAFDVLGERWTPLLLRELAIGPRRYADLLEGLPGVSPSLLTQRLRELEEDGIVQRSYLPPPAARAVYELTDDGVGLATALVPLARWGARRLRPRREDETFSLSWVLLFLRATADATVAIAQSRAMQVIRGEHLVRPDGTVGLGVYGSVPVVRSRRTHRPRHVRRHRRWRAPRLRRR